MPIGALFSINLWLGNTANLYLSVAFVQMLKVRRLPSILLIPSPDCDMNIFCRELPMQPKPSADELNNINARHCSALELWQSLHMEW